MTATFRGSFNAFLLASMVAAPLAASYAEIARAQDGETPAAAPAQAPAAAPAASSLADVWRQFSHYTLIARPDLAAKAAEALNAEDVSGEQLLAAIEAAQTRYQDVEKVTASAAKFDALKAQSSALAAKIQGARIARAKDAHAILLDIEQLGNGGRAYKNAVERLKASGAYAAPHYLLTLQDPAKKRLHPHVLTAMAEVGDSLAYPLSVAVGSLDATTAEHVADVLAQIRQPVALPYLKAAIENPGTRQITRNVFLSAFRDIAAPAHVAETEAATLLFTRLGEGIYQASCVDTTSPLATLNSGVVADKGIFWQFVPGVGLTAITTPGVALSDHLAMQMAENALAINPKNAIALNLHLAANLRRENRLKGEADAAYPANRQPPAIHALVAGPGQQEAILIRALDNRDAELALDAVDALAKTSARIQATSQRQPLVECLTYGDARVRFSAALALSNAAPREEFPGSGAVVPILAQAIRAGAPQPNALVISGSDAKGAQSGAIATALEKSGFKMALGGRTLAEAKVISQPAVPSLDLIVYAGSLADFNNLMAGIQAQGLYRTIPVLALVDSETAVAIKAAYPGNPRISTSSAAVLAPEADEAKAKEKSDALTKAAMGAIQNYRGGTLDATWVDTCAQQAIAQLREIALTPSIYHADDARMALEAALADSRPSIAIGAARVLEKLDRAECQNALLKAVIAGGGDVQEAQFNALAQSFEAFGNKADSELFRQLVELFKSAPTLGAARAIGAGQPSPDLAVSAILPKAESK